MNEKVYRTFQLKCRYPPFCTKKKTTNWIQLKFSCQSAVCQEMCILLEIQFFRDIDAFALSPNFWWFRFGSDSNFRYSFAHTHANAEECLRLYKTSQKLKMVFFFFKHQYSSSEKSTYSTMIVTLMICLEFLCKMLPCQQLLQQWQLLRLKKFSTYPMDDEIVRMLNFCLVYFKLFILFFFFAFKSQYTQVPDFPS